MRLFNKLRNLKEKICSSSALVYSFALKSVNPRAYNTYLTNKVKYEEQRVFDCNTGYIGVSRPKYIPELGLVSILMTVGQ